MNFTCKYLQPRNAFSNYDLSVGASYPNAPYVLNLTMSFFLFALAVVVPFSIYENWRYFRYAKLRLLYLPGLIMLWFTKYVVVFHAEYDLSLDPELGPVWQPTSYFVPNLIFAAHLGHTLVAIALSILVMWDVLKAKKAASLLKVSSMTNAVQMSNSGRNPASSSASTSVNGSNVLMTAMSDDSWYPPTTAGPSMSPYPSQRRTGDIFVKENKPIDARGHDVANLFTAATLNALFEASSSDWCTVLSPSEVADALSELDGLPVGADNQHAIVVSADATLEVHAAAPDGQLDANNDALLMLLNGFLSERERLGCAAWPVHRDAESPVTVGGRETAKRVFKLHSLMFHLVELRSLLTDGTMLLCVRP
jgi:hypothetical protein